MTKLTQDQIAKLGRYDEEMEGAILSLAVSLVKQKQARGLDISQAKEETAAYLDRLSKELRSLEDKTNND